MVWAGISIDGKTDLHVIAGNLSGVRYRDEILLKAPVGCLGVSDVWKRPSVACPRHVQSDSCPVNNLATPFARPCHSQGNQSLHELCEDEHCRPLK
jgi:hypothetical protein